MVSKAIERRSALQARIASVQEVIAAAAARAGRSPQEVTLVAVSKTVDRSAVDAAFAAGIRNFGENRVQDAVRKFETPLPQGGTLHMIGQLQSNKAKSAIGIFDIVESVDRASLIEALAKYADAANQTLPILLQVNVAGEAQKAGCPPDEVEGLLHLILSKSSLSLEGLMTIAPLVSDREQTRPVFRALYELREKLRCATPDLDLSILSMGMTNDYEIAIEEGATEVRIGRAIFGER
jgi:pyridoxal phosphate enzyme (YggS family)